MDHYKIPVNKPFVYVGGRQEDYGKTVLVEDFMVYFVIPAPALRREYGYKNGLEASASILIDNILSTTCKLNELLPIHELKILDPKLKRLKNTK